METALNVCKLSPGSSGEKFIIDTAATASVASKKWLTGHLDWLRNKNQPQTEWSASNKPFKFGYALTVSCQAIVTTPVAVGGEWRFLKVHIFEKDVPNLLSMNGIVAIGGALDMPNKAITLKGGKTIRLGQKPNGLVCIDFRENEVSENKMRQVVKREDTGNSHKPHPGKNPINCENGERLRCYICKSLDHLVPKCPERVFGVEGGKKCAGELGGADGGQGIVASRKGKSKNGVMRNGFTQQDIVKIASFFRDPMRVSCVKSALILRWNSANSDLSALEQFVEIMDGVVSAFGIVFVDAVTYVCGEKWLEVLIAWLQKIALPDAMRSYLP